MYQYISLNFVQIKQMNELNIYSNNIDIYICNWYNIKWLKCDLIGITDRGSGVNLNCLPNNQSYLSGFCPGYEMQSESVYLTALGKESYL